MEIGEHYGGGKVVVDLDDEGNPLIEFPNKERMWIHEQHDLRAEVLGHEGARVMRLLDEVWRRRDLRRYNEHQEGYAKAIRHIREEVRREYGGHA